MLKTMAIRVLNRLTRDQRIPEVSINQLAPPPSRQVSPILDNICMPPYYNEGEFLQNDFGVLMRLLMHHQPSVIFEYGTGYGNTTANICKVTKRKFIRLTRCRNKSRASW